MAKPAFAVYLDLAGDGTFSTNITAYVVAANWQIGFSEPLETMARDNTCSITVNNLDKRFSPEYTSGAYFPDLRSGVAIKITSTYLSITRTMWLGWIYAVSPNDNTMGERKCEIEGVGWFDRAQLVVSKIPLQLFKRADEIIEAILENSATYPPGFTSYWELGTGQIGVTTRLGATSVYYTADTGQTVFDYAGDWDVETTVHEAITQTVEREAGRFFCNRNGILVFYDRHHMLTNTTVVATLNNKSIAMDYIYGADIANWITVNYEPRVTGTPASTLAILGFEQEIPALSTAQITYSFTNSTSGGQVGATAVITPVAITDFTAFDLPNGLGNDVTSQITATQVSAMATEMVINYTNASSNSVYLQGTSKLRGTPLTSYGAQVYSVIDETSRLSHGRLGYSPSGTQDNLTDATTLGDFHLALRKDPVGKIASITFSGWNTTITADLLSTTMGDRVTLNETQTAATGDWFVIGESHSIAPDNYQVQWILENVGDTAYWALGNTGYSNIGQTTVLGPL